MPELPFKVKAIYDYSSAHDDDLNFPNGQVITVTEEEDTDWYYGGYVDSSGEKQEGIFPRNFVERYEPEAPPRPSRSQRGRKHEAPSQEAETARHDAEPVAPEGLPAISMVPSPQGDDGSSARDAPRPRRSIDDQEPRKPAAATTTTNLVRPTPPEPPVAPAQAETKRSTVEDKPVTSSFKDRIAAFNKSSAPPPAPIKPSGLSSAGSAFVKKPFVAPPPSRGAYIPIPREVPPKVYRREENEGVATTAAVSRPPVADERSPERSAQSPEHPQTTDAPEESKPTSLKERIALLQKQQLENAMRHAEPSQKREHVKKPAKARPPPVEATERQEEKSAGEGMTLFAEGRDDQPSAFDQASAFQHGGQSTDGSKSRQAPASSLLSAGPTDFASDANDADQSGADEVTEDPEDHSTEQEGDRPTRPKAPAAPGRAPGLGPPEQDLDSPEPGQDGQEEEDEEQDEEMDPEVKRRMELRERMAKMSGGMGMHGMLGLPGALPRPAPTGKVGKRDKAQPDRKPDATAINADESAQLDVRDRPIQVMPLPLPPRQPDQGASLESPSSQPGSKEAPGERAGDSSPTGLEGDGSAGPPIPSTFLAEEPQRHGQPSTLPVLALQPALTFDRASCVPRTFYGGREGLSISRCRSPHAIVIAVAAW